MERLSTGDPQQVGQFRLVGLLGAGGMGRVFLGRAPDGTAAAVKVVHPYLLNGDETEFRQRFVREVGAARRVDAASTAPVLAADPHADVPWLATEFVPGITLGAAVERFGPLPEASLLTLAAGLLTALAGIHAAGLVHRDIKPANVMLDVDGPKVIDFGIARPAGATGLTRTGQTVGTLGFMSPEQFERSDVGAESDIFSAGAVLAYAATGRPPFPGDTLPVLLAGLTTRAPDLDGVPASLAPLVEALLAKSPEDRPTLEAARAMVPAPPTHIGADTGWLPPAVTHAVLRAAAAALRAPGADVAHAATATATVPPSPEARATPAPSGPSTVASWERFGLPAAVLGLVSVSSHFWRVPRGDQDWVSAIWLVRFLVVGLLVFTAALTPRSTGPTRGAGYLFALSNAYGFTMVVKHGAGPTLAHNVPLFCTAIALSIAAYCYRDARTRRIRSAVT
jgi:hypothetical protein